MGATGSLNFVFDKPLNLSRLKFLKQGAADTRGYFLVKGLSLVSETKSVLVNRVNGSSVVCVKDAEVDSIGEVSAGCNGVDEYLVGCDGSVTSDGYRCVIRDAYFNVSGLHHSAVVEFVETEGGKNSIVLILTLIFAAVAMVSFKFKKK